MEVWVINVDVVRRGFRFGNPYRGTVLELVDCIPVSCPCEEYRGKPGVLVYFDFLAPVDEGYALVLSGERLDQLVTALESEGAVVLSYIPWEKFLLWDPLGEGS